MRKFLNECVFDNQSCQNSSRDHDKIWNRGRLTHRLHFMHIKINFSYCNCEIQNHKDKLKLQGFNSITKNP